MSRTRRSARQQSQSPDRLDELINLRRYPVDPVEYQNLLQQHQALLAAIDAVPTPASPDDGLLRHPMFQGLGPMLPDVPEDLFALDREASARPEAASGRRASRRSRSATPASRGRFAVGSTPTLPAQSPRVGDLINRGFFDLPANYFDSSPPRARAVSAVAGGEGSPSYTSTWPAYTPNSPAYNPISPEYVPYPYGSSPRSPLGGAGVPSPSYNPTSPAYRPGPVLGPYGALSASPARSPVGGAVARRLDGIDATLERLQRRVDLRADRIDAQLLAITQALSDQREGAATPNNDRKRKRSSDKRDVVDLTGKTPSPKSPKKVDFGDLVTESSWSGSEFSSSGSSSSSSDSSSSSSESTVNDDDDDDDDKPRTPSKKPKYSSDAPFASPRSPKTPPNNRTPSPPKTPRKAPPKRPAPRTPPRQRAPSVPSTPPAPRKTRAAAASRSPAAQAPRKPPQQTSPAGPTPPAAPRKNRSRSREATTSPTPAAAPAPAPAPTPAPARQPTRASSRIRERAAGTAYRPLLRKSFTGRGPRSCPRPGHK